MIDSATSIQIVSFLMLLFLWPLTILLPLMVFRAWIFK